MGEVELDKARQVLTVRSNIITYGNATTTELTELIREEIESMWNEPQATVFLNNMHFRVRFAISSECKPDIDQIEVLSNTDPKNNYFRIEEFVHGNISFVDGIGCNTGYFLLENLYRGSTTAAHEYGHTLGLDHPAFLDLRGQGIPGIMYPRGTLVEPQFQYDPTKPAGATGGTMHPKNRKVKAEDVEALKFSALRFTNNGSIIGAFTNIYHWNHADLNTTR